MSTKLPCLFAAAILLAASLIWVQPRATAQTAPAAAAVITIQSSPESGHTTQLDIHDADFLIDALRRSPSRPAFAAPVTDTYVRIQGVLYASNANTGLYQAERQQWIELQGEAGTILRQYIQTLRDQHYGNLVQWESAKKIVERYAVIRIVDLETGLAFQGQRRAGSSHADVQPLTAADTRIMKEIYRGRWSWDRRPAIVEYEGHRLAASMNGMPHGGDGIPGNRFSGHFCIHFLGSTTHGSGNSDPLHQFMIHAAAGRMDTYLAEADPAVIADLYFTALNKNNRQLLRKLFEDANPEEQLMWLEEKAVYLPSGRPAPDARGVEGSLTAELTIPVRVIRAGGERKRTVFTIRMGRLSHHTPWIIEEALKVDL